MDRFNVIIAGGGTGGHLFPALAIGEEINHRNPNAKIHYVGSIFGLESKVFPVKDVWHTLLPISGLNRNFNLSNIGKNILLPLRLFRSFFIVKKLMKDFTPQVVIGTGGYASALPLYVASKSDLSTPIILQEQNSFPGITTRWFAKNAEKICVAFEEPKSKLDAVIKNTGNPVRRGISKGNAETGFKFFGLDPNKKTIFLFGGSQGSSYLNKMMKSIVINLSNAGIQIIWQTGDSEYLKYEGMKSKTIYISPFINNMADAYAVSELIICRSGALTISEITVCGKPAILIPFPFAAGDHQTKNAQSLVKARAATILYENNLEPHEFQNAIMNLIRNDSELKKMSNASRELGKPNATKKIVDHIFETIA